MKNMKKRTKLFLTRLLIAIMVLNSAMPAYATELSTDSEGESAIELVVEGETEEQIEESTEEETEEVTEEETEEESEESTEEESEEATEEENEEVTEEATREGTEETTEGAIEESAEEQTEESTEAETSAAVPEDTTATKTSEPETQTSSQVMPTVECICENRCASADDAEECPVCSEDYELCEGQLITAPITIVGQSSETLMVYVGQEVTLWIEADSQNELSYQWMYKPDDENAEFTEVAEGGDGPELTIDVTEENIGYLYKCAISDDYGSLVISESIILEGLTGWDESDWENQRYYKDGIMVTDDMIQDENGDYYYLDVTGEMLKDSWKCFVDESGAYWWRYFEEDGRAIVSAEFELHELGENGECYAFDADGIMMDGWVSSAENQMVTGDEAWKYADYYFYTQFFTGGDEGNHGGYLKTGWVVPGAAEDWDWWATWYETGVHPEPVFYFSTEELNYGQKVTGVQSIDDKLYIFEEDGCLLYDTRTTVDGIVYEIDQYGVATKVKANLAAITQQPENQYGKVSDTVVFSIEAENTTSYQWYCSANGAEWMPIAEETESVLEVLVTEENINDSYRCQVTDANGYSQYSSVVMVSPYIAGGGVYWKSAGIATWDENWLTDEQKAQVVHTYLRVYCDGENTDGYWGKTGYVSEYDVGASFTRSGEYTFEVTFAVANQDNVMSYAVWSEPSEPYVYNLPETALSTPSNLKWLANGALTWDTVEGDDISYEVILYKVDPETERYAKVAWNMTTNNKWYMKSNALEADATYVFRVRTIGDINVYAPSEWSDYSEEFVWSLETLYPGLVTDGTWIETDNGWMCYQDGELVRSRFVVFEDAVHYVDEQGGLTTNTTIVVNGYSYRIDKNGVVSGTDMPSSTGWKQVEVDGVLKWVYFVDGNLLKNEFRQSGGNYYYLGSDGYMVTSSLFEYDGNMYYADAQGIILKNGVVLINGETYVADENHVITKVEHELDGWILIDSYWLYYKNGNPVTNSFVNKGNTIYYLDEDGHIVKNQFLEYDGNTYYVDKGGALICDKILIMEDVAYSMDENGIVTVLEQIPDGWISTDGKSLYYENGSLAVNSFVKKSGLTCYVGADGCMVKSQFVEYEGNMYYIDELGSLACNVTIVINGTIYTIDENGIVMESTEIADGWVKTVDGWRYYQDGIMVVDAIVPGRHYTYSYVDSDGDVVTNSFIEYEGQLYYFGSEGWCYTGWQYFDMDDSIGYDYHWMYFKSNGKACKRVLKTINGKKYIFDENGYMLSGWVFRGETLNELSSMNGKEEWKKANSYFGSDDLGDMQIGWQQINVYGGWKDETGYADYTFYFTDEGYKVVGPCVYIIDEVNYCFDQYGALLMNTTIEIDGVTYDIDADGIATAMQAVTVEIVSQPESAVGVNGGSVTFQVSAESTAEINYQWYWRTAGSEGSWSKVFDGTGSYEGATTDTLVVPVTSYRRNYEYCCKLSVLGEEMAQTDVVRILDLGVTINSQPVSAAGANGDYVNFTVSAESTEEISYQWYWRSAGSQGGWSKAFDGSGSYAGTTTDTLEVFVTSFRRNYEYCCKLSVHGQVVAQTDAVQILDFGVTINSQPISVVGVNGEKVSFNVSAESTEEISYQWYWRTAGSEDGWNKVFNGAGSYEGATTDTLIVPVVDFRRKYEYCCKLSVQGQEVVQTETVKILGLTVKSQPVSVVGVNGENITFQVSAESTEEIGYQWYWRTAGSEGSWNKVFDGSGSYSGATTDTLTVPVVGFRRNYEYCCKLNVLGLEVMQTDVVRILDLGVTINSQPVSVAGINGETVTFEVSAESSEEISYQWYWRTAGSEGGWSKVFDGTGSYAGATTATLSVPVTSYRRNYEYCCKLSVFGREVEETDIVKILNLGVTISSQPVSVVGVNGETVTFEVSAESDEEISYQWYWRTAGSEGDWSKVFDGTGSYAGAVTATLSVPVTSYRRNYEYCCKLSVLGQEVKQTDVVKILDPGVTIKNQPVSVAGTVGDMVTFEVTAESTEEIGYQWYWRTAGTDEGWSKVRDSSNGYSGSQTSVLNVVVTGYRKNYEYCCILSILGEQVVTTNIVKITE